MTRVGPQTNKNNHYDSSLVGQSRPRYLGRYNDSLRAGRSGDRVPLEDRFSVPVQTGTGAFTASCTMGTGSFASV